MRTVLSLLPITALVFTACSAPASEASDGTMQDEQQVAGPEVQFFRGERPSPNYSPAVRVGDIYYFSGKIGASGETRGMEEGRTAAELHNIMGQFQELFDELGIGFEDVVQATIYLDELDAYGEMNEAWQQYFPENPPARETLAVDLVAGAAIEISFVAVAR